MGRVVFRPESLPPTAVYAIALVPPVAAGLVLFGLPAAIDLAAALAVGALAAAALRLAGRRPWLSPLIACPIGVALLGPGAAWWWAAVVAAAAAVLEVGRALVRRPFLPVSSSLVAYAAVYLAGHGALAAYLAPGRTLRAFPEPIRLWHAYSFSGSASPLDPVTLYVGNVAGPVFATSLLAVTIGIAWLWYAKRLDLLAVIGFAAGALVVAVGEHWNPAFQLLSGPLLFAVGYGFADRRLLAGPPLLGLLYGLAAGLVGVGLRTRGFDLEVAFVALAGVQVAVALVVALAATVRSGAPRRLTLVAWASQLK